MVATGGRAEGGGRHVPIAVSCISAVHHTRQATRHQLLLWLAALVRVPFDLSTIDSSLFSANPVQPGADSPRALNPVHYTNEAPGKEAEAEDFEMLPVHEEILDKAKALLNAGEITKCAHDFNEWTELWTDGRTRTDGRTDADGLRTRSQSVVTAPH